MTTAIEYALMAAATFQADTRCVMKAWLKHTGAGITHWSKWGSTSV